MSLADAISSSFLYTEAGEQRSRLQTAAAVDSRTMTERHEAETAELRRQLDCSREDVAQLQRQLTDAGDRQGALVVELRRMSQQLSSSQMELEASRAIAAAQRETILAREAEVARFEARGGLIQPPGRSDIEDAARAPPGTSLTTPPVQTVEQAGVGSAGPEVDLTTTASVDNGDDRSANPDSLLTIWQQLQLNDSIRSSAGDAARRTVDPSAGASTRFGSALEEKQRVQDRVKALIGYRAPATKKSAAAAKPRLSVRPQPPAHSKSSASSTLLKSQRRTPATDSVSTSQHFASSSLDRLATTS